MHAPRGVDLTEEPRNFLRESENVIRQLPFLGTTRASE